MNRSRAIADDVLTVLSAGLVDGDRYYLPQRQLDRKLYERTNEVLAALGGRWNRKAKAHLFDHACEDVIESAIETGEYTRPADMGWFPTPPDVAARIVDMADVRPGHAVLEPSAGEGAIACIAAARGADVYAIEIDSARFAVLARMGFWVAQLGDFLNVGVPQTFDRVVMNPPFAQRADIRHVLHARNNLKPDGLLVSIMSAGIAFREDRITRDFRAQCESIEALPDGSFRASGTNVRTVVVTMRSQP